MISMIKDSELNKSQIHEQLSFLLERFIIVYGAELGNKDQPLQICQGEVNLRYCQEILKYYSTQLEIKHTRINNWSYVEKLQQVTVELRRKLRELIESKIQIIMSSYQSPEIWIPKEIIDKPHDFVGWLMEYVCQTVRCMKQIGSPFHEQIAYSAAGHICYLFWEALKQAKQFNLIAIYNLDVDLLTIYRYCIERLNNYQNIMDRFKSLRQFFSLLLTNNINDIVDQQKREIAYSSLDFSRIIPILKKFVAVKNNQNGKVRELKKKDLDNLIKKMETQFK